MTRRPPMRFVPAPPPSARRIDGAQVREHVPALPSTRIGAPTGPHPGIARPAPRLGGIRGVGAPPELRRRVPGARRVALGASDVTEHIRSALRKAQLKLLAAKQKLESGSLNRRSEVLGRSQVLESR
jgi:hypothetical protein